MNCKWIIAFFFLGFAWFVFQIIQLFDLAKELKIHSIEKCQKISIENPTEDLITYKNLVIGVASDIPTLFFKHHTASLATPGFLFAFDPAKNFYYRIKTHNFNTEYAFNPNGITIFNDKLYVLSHSFAKGGERIFVFALTMTTEIEADFVKSIEIDQNHGFYNSLTFVDEEHFFITQWSPFADMPEGRDFSFNSEIKRIWAIFSPCGTVKKCKVDGEKANCLEIMKGYVPNGIEIIGNNVFIADSVDKKVKVYEMNENLDLEFKDEVKLHYSPDNLRAYNGEIYTTGIFKSFDFISITEAFKSNSPLPLVPGTAGRIFFNGTKWVTQDLLTEDILSFPTGCTVANNIFILTGIVESNLLVCSLENLLIVNSIFKNMKKSDLK
ncbi:hypothetical protein SteCoe_28798 [Stentor coeruleus]|uniref:SMP-30/Gluconolactonase/LRE-like region domain-containing protein n=1 Tax=Stentor coeruleus TaxID=5963 RepID=A0A1R2B7E3_9CILI|nr:hypothetical protein SteCoe_28798 [Stentor coeruleus]